MKNRILQLCATVAGIAVGLVAATSANAATTLETVKARGKLICGVSMSTPGFATADAKGHMGASTSTSAVPWPPPFSAIRKRSISS